MDELREQLASVGTLATAAPGPCACELLADARALATLYKPPRASGRTEIAWPVLRMAG
jgi:hypothetical protein